MFSTVPRKDPDVPVKIECAFCHKIITLTVKQSQLTAYQNGEYVQKAFPNLSASQRELFITQMCSECWDKTFKKER